MLTETGTRVKVNNLSPELREKLDKQIKKYGKKVKYRFTIGHKNPDPEKHGGAMIFPSLWMLQPVTYFIDDRFKDDKGIERIERRKIGLPVAQMDQHGDAAGFNNIKLMERDAGILDLDLDKSTDQDRWAYLEMHPEHRNGLFGSESGLFEHVDEVSEAKRRVETRRKRDEAMSVAANWSIGEHRDFAAAMGWDEHQDEYTLQDKIQELAEKDPDFFTEFVEGKSPHYRATITRAENAKLIAWVAPEYKYQWEATGETIVSFGRIEGIDRLEKMADWLMTDKVGITVFEKIKAILKTKFKKTEVPA